MAVAATSADGAAPILRLRGVGRRFGGVHAVRDVGGGGAPRGGRAGGRAHRGRAETHEERK